MVEWEDPLPRPSAETAEMLLLLEDDPDRLVRFRRVCDSLGIEMKVWRNAATMNLEIGGWLEPATVISLDHDLEPDSDGLDPGDGYAVAKFLTSQPIVRPVIVHSSNRERSTWMVGEFELAGWPCRSVYPLGEDWIEVDWRRAVKHELSRGNSR